MWEHGWNTLHGFVLLLCNQFRAYQSTEQLTFPHRGQCIEVATFPSKTRSNDDIEGVTKRATLPSAPLTSTKLGPSSGTGRNYYLVFVNTPNQSLVNSKLPVDFEKSSTVLIGRDSGNDVVIPDQVVSRVHAELTMKDGRVFLKDLRSRNGTFLYVGTDFKPVGDSVMVTPNSVIRLGTTTILELTRE